MRIWPLALLVACNPRESRLEPVLQGAAPRPRPERKAERVPDERDRELDRNLRELTTRPEEGSGKGTPLDQVLGTRPGPFGPLAALQPEMTRAEVLAALPAAQTDGEVLWVPTGIDAVTVEIFFDPTDRLEEILYHVPLSARPTLVTAWGAPISATNLWFDRERRWRARLGEDAINGKIELGITGYTAFSSIIGRGPDALAETKPIIGRTLPELAAAMGARLIPPSFPGAPAELIMPGASDVCADATRLVLPVGPNGRVARAVVYQCYDEEDHNRRGALTMMEQAWGRAQPLRTRDDRLVFSWNLPGRRIEALPTQEGHQARWVWEIAISPR